MGFPSPEDLTGRGMMIGNPPPKESAWKGMADDVIIPASQYIQIAVLEKSFTDIMDYEGEKNWVLNSQYKQK